MRLSLALATYNGIKYIEKQLASLMKQTRQFDEVIIIDDASIDYTYDFIKNFIIKNSLSNWRLFRNDKNIGYILNFRRAVAMCTGDIIFTCDQDDIWHSDKAETMEKLFKKNQDVKAIASSLQFINENDCLMDRDYTPYGWKKSLEEELKYVSFDNIMEKNFFPGCVTVYRKDIIQRYISNINKEVPHDWAINIYASMEGGLLWYNKKLVDYRIHGKNTVGLEVAQVSRIQYAINTVLTWNNYIECQEKRIKLLKREIENMSIEIRSAYSNQTTMVVLRKKNLLHRNIKSFINVFIYYYKFMRGKVDIRGIVIDATYVFRFDRILRKLSRGNHE